MEQISNGKKFSDIIDSSIFQQFSDFHGDRFIKLLNDINVPKRSCYNEILYQLQFDCEDANEEQQRILALHFTQCYYNITGKLNEFPTGIIDELKTSMMSQSVYSIYTSMKAHWKNLCQFAKQNVFTEQTSNSLIDLYQSILESMNSILSLKKELNETSQFFNKSFSNMTTQINRTAKNIEEIQALFESFTGYFDTIHTFIQYASTTLHQMKFFSLIIIITLLFALYIPKMLIPVTAITIVFGFIDRFIRKNIEGWNNSFYRQIFKYTYAIICFSYPAFLIFKYINKLFNFVVSLAKESCENIEQESNKKSHNEHKEKKHGNSNKTQKEKKDDNEKRKKAH